jgi:hypothetical protein
MDATGRCGPFFLSLSQVRVTAKVVRETQKVKGAAGCIAPGNGSRFIPAAAGKENAYNHQARTMSAI